MKIAVFGLGVSGICTLKYLATTDNEVFAINQGPINSWPNLLEVKSLISEDKLYPEDKATSLVTELDQIILSPGISREHYLVKEALENNVKVICDVELAFKDFKGKVIAVTGTNGKTTTVTMISELLKGCGISVFTGGNIGVGACELLLSKKSYDVAVLELSSFQLESIDEFHANMAFILNINENHMERYPSILEYQKAKYNILKNMDSGDILYLASDLVKPNANYKVKEISRLKKFDYSKSKVLGAHNEENFFCAYQVLDFLNIKNKDEIFQKFINSFSGVKHRLQHVGEKNGLTFYNDAKSTNLNATVSALEAIKELKGATYLILGGRPRTDEIKPSKTISEHQVDLVFAFGAARQLIKNDLADQYQVEVFEHLDEVISYLIKNKLRGNVLFSPAFPSFDQYENYIKRGEHFLELVDSI